MLDYKQGNHLYYEFSDDSLRYFILSDESPFGTKIINFRSQTLKLRRLYLPSFGFIDCYRLAVDNEKQIFHTYNIN